MTDLGYTVIGPYVVGEIPEPWEHQFLDSDDDPIDLTGYEATLTYRVDADDQVVRTAASVTAAATGKATYSWIAADLATAGRMRGELTVGNGTNRYARTFRMYVRAPAGGALPAI